MYIIFAVVFYWDKLFKTKGGYLFANYIILKFLPCITWTLIYRFRIKNSWHAGWQNEVWALEVWVF